jgi:hypothetical protein
MTADKVVLTDESPACKYGVSRTASAARCELLRAIKGCINASMGLQARFLFFFSFPYAFHLTKFALRHSHLPRSSAANHSIGRRYYDLT